MRLIFVRHGHPNYKDDCLTELGHLHAEAAADRLSGEKISAIFSSSNGRAMETAQHIADRLGMTVEPLDFMREIRWGSVDGEEIPLKGHPWFTTDTMVREGKDLWDQAWEDSEIFCRNKVVECVRNVQCGMEAWLATLGYSREGLYFRANSGTDKTYLLAAHGGSSIAAMAYMLNLPFPLAIKLIRPDFTAITVLSLNGEEGSLVCPEIELMNDARHIESILPEKTFEN